MAVLVPGPAAAQPLGNFDWSGFYAGAEAGFVRSSNAVNLDYPTAPPSSGYGFSGNKLIYNGVRDSGLPTLFGLDSQGRITGLDAGYNWQAGHFVFGLEGDWSGLNGDAMSARGASPSGKTKIDVTTRLDALLTARARAGVAVDRLLFFATGGLALGQTSVATDFNYADTGKGTGATGRASGMSGGVVGGLGLEYALSNNVSLKAEGLYYWLSGQSATATGSGHDGVTPKPMQPYSATENPSGVTVRAGINIHF